LVIIAGDFFRKKDFTDGETTQRFSELKDTGAVVTDKEQVGELNVKE
jgi:hypothetical protein